MATLKLNVLGDQFEGRVDILEVDDGKYGFVIQDFKLVAYLRYGVKWNMEEIYEIPFNNATTHAIMDLYDLLRKSMDDGK